MILHIKQYLKKTTGPVLCAVLSLCLTDSMQQAARKLLNCLRYVQCHPLALVSGLLMYLTLFSTGNPECEKNIEKNDQMTNRIQWWKQDWEQLRGVPPLHSNRGHFFLSKKNPLLGFLPCRQNLGPFSLEIDPQLCFLRKVNSWPCAYRVSVCAVLHCVWLSV